MLRVAFATLVLSASAAVAGTPFGGDDYGFFPPSRTVAKCEQTVGAGLAKAVLHLTQCRDRAQANPGFDYGYCLARTYTKLQIIDTTNCGLCTKDLFLGSRLETEVARIVDGWRLVSCTPDDWTSPPTPAQLLCAKNVGDAVATLFGAITKCHAKRARRQLADDGAEDACESHARARFMPTSTDGCPPCLDLAAVAGFVEAYAGGDNGFVYCASPSGAFLNGTPDRADR